MLKVYFPPVKSVEISLTLNDMLKKVKANHQLQLFVSFSSCSKESLSIVLALRTCSLAVL